MQYSDSEDYKLDEADLEAEVSMYVEYFGHKTSYNYSRFSKS